MQQRQLAALRFSFVLFLGLFFSLLTAPQARAEEAQEKIDGLSFHLPFENNLESAVGQNGSPFSKKGEPIFVPGRSGQALRTGTKDSYLIYRAAGKVRGEEGSVSLWVRPQWDRNNVNFHTLWNLHGDGRFMLYRSDGNKLIFLYRGKGLTDQQFNTLTTSTEDWKANEWHHVAVTWRAGQVRLFVDGGLKREVTDAQLVLPEVTQTSDFFIGDAYHPGYAIHKTYSGVADTDLDEFKLFDRALSPQEIGQLAGKANATMTPPITPYIVVPKTKNPPRIDGDFTFDEWKDAAGFTGFIDLSKRTLAERQTSVLLTYDDKNLYIATFAPLPGELPLKSTVDKRDGAVYGDDAIEIYLDPQNTRKSDQLVQFVGNSGGYFLDIKNGDSNWNGNWQYKSGMVGNWRSFGQTYWVTELALPFDALGRSTPQNGEQWTANFARSWYTPTQLFTAWAWTEKITYGNAERFGTLEFSENSPAFEWTVLRNLAEGQPVLEGNAPASDKVKLQVSLSGGQQKLLDKEFVSPTPKPLYWIEPVDITGAPSDKLRVEAKANSRTLYKAEMPYQLDDQPVRLLVNAVPSQELLLADIDPVRFRKEWNAGGQLEVSLNDQQGKKLDSHSFTSAEKLPVRARLSLKNVAPGSYQVNVVVKDKTGKTLVTQASPFTKPNPPVWLNNKIGVTDKVLKPWTPLEAQSGTVKMWARDYNFGNNALPQQITSLGETVLQSPARLMVDGKPLLAGNAKTDEKTPARVVRSGASQSGPWQVDWKCTAEYDGMLWYEVTLTPNGNQATALNSLALELPLRPETSGLYNASNGSFGLGGGESGATPAQWNSGWKQVFWLGNERAGLCWFAESDQNWKLGNPRDALSFSKNANGTLAKVQFVSAPKNISGPTTYRFGLQATPTRPMPENWRSTQWSSRGSDSIATDKPFQPTNSISWWMEWSPKISSPFDIKPEAAQAVAKYHEAGIKVIPYQALIVLNDLAPDFDYYRAEWLNQPQMNGGGEAGQQTWYVNVKGSYQDYFLYALREMVRNQKWDGIYFDFSQGAVADRNEFHGSGYVDENGVRHPTFDLLAQREFYKRLWHMLQEETGSDEPVVMIHNSACIVPPVHSFTNIYFDGEQFNFTPKVDDDYTKVLTRDSFRAEFLGSTFGGVPMFLPELGHLQQKVLRAKTEPEKSQAHATWNAALDTLMLYPPLHGTLFTPSRMDLKYLQPYLEGRRNFNMATARFHGYWENQSLLSQTASSPEVFTSLYAHDDRFWLVTGNWTNAEQSVTIKLNLSKISPKFDLTKASSKNIWKDGAFTANGDSYRYTVPPKTVRIIEMKGQ